MKNINILFIFLFFSTCSMEPNLKMSSFNKEVNQALQSDSIFSFERAFNSFKWDYLVIVGSYIYYETVEEKLKINIPLSRENNQHDGFQEIFFYKDKIAVGYLEVKSPAASIYSLYMGGYNNQYIKVLKEKSKSKIVVRKLKNNKSYLDMVFIE